MGYMDANKSIGCNTIDMASTAQGLVIGERFERYKLEAMTELALRTAGILMIMGSIAMWFFLPVDPGTGRLASFGVMASIMAASGLCVFAYGTRGFCRRVTLDMKTSTLTLTKINMHDHARVNHEIDLGAIESVFLRRPVEPGGTATLLVRVAGRNAPAVALTGDTHEVEEVHGELCTLLKRDPALQTDAPSLRLAAAHPAPRARVFAG